MLITGVMPELPEVETVVRGLREAFSGNKIAGVSHCAAHIRRLNKRGFAGMLPGRTIESFERVGKNIFINLDDQSLIWVHLRMTGQFLHNCVGAKKDPHHHLVISFEDNDNDLVFRDVRKFGQFVYVSEGERAKFLAGLNLGHDALEISREEFVETLHVHTRMIKPLLLDQSLIAGLGNIYVDEILYKSRVHPRKLASKIAIAKLESMHAIMQETLRFSIENMGTTIDSFSDLNSEPGRNQNYLLAYGNAGELCARCRRAKIRRIVVAQRGTFICPHCQRL